MSGNDLVFNEAAVNYIVDDVERAASKLRDGSAEMSDLVEHELIEWTDSSEARQAQMECAQRMDARVEDLAAALDEVAWEVMILKSILRRWVLPYRN